MLFDLDETSDDVAGDMVVISASVAHESARCSEPMTKCYDHGIGGLLEGVGPSQADFSVRGWIAGLFAR